MTSHNYMFVHDPCIFPSVIVINHYQYALATTFAGILVFSETDLQHAVYWSRDKSSDDQRIMLKQFEDVWR